MRRATITIFTTLLIVSACPLFAKDADKLARLSFLVGTWEASSGGTTASTNFERALNGKVIIRRSSATYPATATTAAGKHEDLMVIYALGDKIRADYFDTEGYAVPYEVTVNGRGEAVFVSDRISGAPRARVTYKLSGSTMNTNLEYAAAEKPDTFAPYLKWDAKKR